MDEDMCDSGRVNFTGVPAHTLPDHAERRGTAARSESPRAQDALGGCSELDTPVFLLS